MTLQETRVHQKCTPEEGPKLLSKCDGIGDPPSLAKRDEILRGLEKFHLS